MSLVGQSAFLILPMRMMVQWSYPSTQHDSTSFEERDSPLASFPYPLYSALLPLPFFPSFSRLARFSAPPLHLHFTPLLHIFASSSTQLLFTASLAFTSTLLTSLALPHWRSTSLATWLWSLVSGSGLWLWSLPLALALALALALDSAQLILIRRHPDGDDLRYLRAPLARAG